MSIKLNQTKSLTTLPTFIIGCGGYGSQIVNTIKNSHLKDYNGNYPRIGGAINFLALDNDSTEKYEELPCLDNDEIITFGRGDLNEKSNKSFISEWFQYSNSKINELKNYLDPSKAGNGTTRPFGRIGLFDNKSLFRQIKNYFNDRLERINNLMDDNVSEDKFNIFIIGSMSGGTGAGIMIDLANIIRWIQRELNIDPSHYWKIHGIGITASGLGNVEIERQDLYEANTYAFIKEIDNLLDQRLGHIDMLAKTRYYNGFEYAEWVKNGNANGHLFNMFFILDGRNNMGRAINTRSQMANMISQAILYLSNSEISDYFSSRSIDMVVADGCLRERFPKGYEDWREIEHRIGHFASFGCATLRIPVRELKDIFKLRYKKIFIESLLNNIKNHENKKEDDINKKIKDIEDTGRDKCIPGFWEKNIDLLNKYFNTNNSNYLDLENEFEKFLPPENPKPREIHAMNLKEVKKALDLLDDEIINKNKINEVVNNILKEMELNKAFKNLENVLSKKQFSLIKIFDAFQKLNRYFNDQKRIYEAESDNAKTQLMDGKYRDRRDRRIKNYLEYRKKIFNRLRDIINISGEDTKIVEEIARFDANYDKENYNYHVNKALADIHSNIIYELNIYMNNLELRKKQWKIDKNIEKQKQKKHLNELHSNTDDKIKEIEKLLNNYSKGIKRIENLLSRNYQPSYQYIPQASKEEWREKVFKIIENEVEADLKNLVADDINSGNISIKDSRDNEIKLSDKYKLIYDQNIGKLASKYVNELFYKIGIEKLFNEKISLASFGNNYNDYIFAFDPGNRVVGGTDDDFIIMGNKLADFSKSYYWSDDFNVSNEQRYFIFSLPEEADNKRKEIEGIWNQTITDRLQFFKGNSSDKITLMQMDIGFPAYILKNMRDGWYNKYLLRLYEEHPLHLDYRYASDLKEPLIERGHQLLPAKLFKLASQYDKIKQINNENLYELDMNYIGPLVFLYYKYHGELDKFKKELEINVKLYDELCENYIDNLVKKDLDNREIERKLVKLLQADPHFIKYDILSDNPRVRELVGNINQYRYSEMNRHPEKLLEIIDNVSLGLTENSKKVNQLFKAAPIEGEYKDFIIRGSEKEFINELRDNQYLYTKICESIISSIEYKNRMNKRKRNELIKEIINNKVLPLTLRQKYEVKFDL